MKEEYTTSRHIYHQIGGIYTIMSDINEIAKMSLRLNARFEGISKV